MGARPSHADLPVLQVEADFAQKELVRVRTSEEPPPWVHLRHLESELHRGALPKGLRLPVGSTVTAPAYARDVLEAWLDEVRPSSTVERLLALQTLWAHVRAARLLACASTNNGYDLVVDAAADRALRTAARLGKALAEVQARNGASEQGCRSGSG